MGDPKRPATDPMFLDDDFEGFEDEYEEAVMNCHKGPDGYCGAAGSEYCEFDCPFR